MTYARKISELPESLAVERQAQMQRVNELRTQGAPAREVATAERTLRDLPRTPDEARVKWERARQDSLQRSVPPPPHAEAHPGPDQASRDSARLNFIALSFVLMVGTAGCRTS
jgi:cation/acetate symporter